MHTSEWISFKEMNSLLCDKEDKEIKSWLLEEGPITERIKSNGDFELELVKDKVDFVRDDEKSFLDNIDPSQVADFAAIISKYKNDTIGITDYDNAEKSITMAVVLTSIAMTSSQGEVLSAEVSFEAADAPTALTLDNA